MSETDFLSRYLREIGVKTPVSLLFCAPNEVSKEETIKPIEVTESSEISNSSTTFAHLSELKVQAILCEACDLSKRKPCVMFGTGNEHTDVLLIGDVPHDVNAEHTQEHVFTEDSSALLNQMLTAIGLQRNQIYETPLIQCPTPEHRDPNVEEWAACETWLQQKITLIQPKIILLMGRVAAQTLLQSQSPLHDLRGQWHHHQGVPTRAIYHPAYLLRSPRQKQTMWNDLQQIQARLKAMDEP
jgi:DNA polymerase